MNMDILLENGKVRSLSSVNNSWPDQDVFELYSAFTTSELMALLPQWVNTQKNEPFNNFNFNLTISRVMFKEVLTRIYLINYHCDTMQFTETSPYFGLRLFKHPIFNAYLVNALAETLIYLHVNGFIKNETN